MIIGVDARVLMDKNYSGVSEYAANLLAALLDMDEMNEYRLYYNSWHDLSARFKAWERPNVKIIKTNYPNKVFNYVLQKICKYPKLDRLVGGCDTFFSPHLNFSRLSAGQKSILTVHDLSFLRYPEFFSGRKNFWHRTLGLKSLLNSFSHLVAVSTSTRADLVELLQVDPEKVTIIHSGINKPNLNFENNLATTYLKQIGINEPYILYLGNLEPRKNIDGLIEAYNIYRATNPNRHDCLVLAGAVAWKTKSILEAYRNSPYKSDIKITGYITEQQKTYLYVRAGLFVYPSFYEGFGFPPLEAMSYGVPVVCSNVSSLPEIVAGAALTIDPYNIASLAEAMSQMIESPELLSQFTRVGKEQAAKFDWQETAKVYLSLFESLFKHP